MSFHSSYFFSGPGLRIPLSRGDRRCGYRVIQVDGANGVVLTCARDALNGVYCSARWQGHRRRFDPGDLLQPTMLQTRFSTVSG